MFGNLESSWKNILKEELSCPYLQDLQSFLRAEGKRGAVIYPPLPFLYQAFEETPFDRVKVVVVGQDPYHGPGQAHGLCFSVPCGLPLPPSLKNIYRELHSDLGIPPAKNGCLLSWAKQGVLLLNATLTVESGKPASHYGKGWERFTDKVIEVLVDRKDPLVFVLWGKNAQEKSTRILQAKSHNHCVLMAPHPSPFSAHQGFFGSRPFSKINDALIKAGKETIHWGIETALVKNLERNNLSYL